MNIVNITNIVSNKLLCRPHSLSSGSPEDSREDDAADDGHINSHINCYYESCKSIISP